MGVMTVYASFLYGIMLESRFGNGLTDVLMAAKAEIIASSDKVELIVRRMGIMAFYAISLENYLVRTPGLFRHYASMAFATDFVCLLGQQFAMGGRMGIMAAGALSRFYRGMNVLLFEYFFEICVAGQATFSPGIWFQFKILRISDCKEEATESQEDEEDAFGTKFHIHSF